MGLKQPIRQLMEDEVGDLGAERLHIVHINVASILSSNTFEMLRQQVVMSNFDMFCASETWLTDGVPDDIIKINGFVHLRLDRSWADIRVRNGCKKGGGLICYTRDTLTCNEFRYALLNKSCRDLEMQWVSLENNNMRRIVIINIIGRPRETTR